MDKESKDYEVGYGRPPKEYQFKPGTSGNYKGRPKKKSDFRRASKTICTIKRNIESTWNYS